MTTCIFCKIVEGAVPSSQVYEDEISLAFMDIQPVNPGHVLVVPKVHCRDLTDLPADVGAHLFQAAAAWRGGGGTGKGNCGVDRGFRRLRERRWT